MQTKWVAYDYIWWFNTEDRLVNQVAQKYWTSLLSTLSIPLGLIAWWPLLSTHVSSNCYSIKGRSKSTGDLAVYIFWTHTDVGTGVWVVLYRTVWIILGDRCLSILGTRDLCFFGSKGSKEETRADLYLFWFKLSKSRFCASWSFNWDYCFSGLLRDCKRSGFELKTFASRFSSKAPFCSSDARSSIVW